MNNRNQVKLFSITLTVAALIGGTVQAILSFVADPLTNFMFNIIVLSSSILAIGLNGLIFLYEFIRN